MRLKNLKENKYMFFNEVPLVTKMAQEVMGKHDEFRMVVSVVGTIFIFHKYIGEKHNKNWKHSQITLLYKEIVIFPTSLPQI